ncbi:hypothetical protein CASFOL_016633 [Castilleja foliolosa]|uniref:Uncharacterized protein n=1 Tax=Castilleja foliolosa TaxID=1961234 RepID=A0ABD3DCQ4_9LAMI
MASNVQNHAKEEENSNFTPMSRPAGPRTSSFSSSNSSYSSYGSSSISFNEEYHTFTPTTPLKFKGIPFSWEKVPGIPKHQSGSKKKEYSELLLPLPPAGKSNSTAEKLLHDENKSNRFQRDPFFAALVECSKDDHHVTNYHRLWKSNSKNNITQRSLSDRIGCKRSCAVSDSTVYLRPRPTPHYLLNRRS